VCWPRRSRCPPPWISTWARGSTRVVSVVPCKFGIRIANDAPARPSVGADCLLHAGGSSLRRGTASSAPCDPDARAEARRQPALPSNGGPPRWRATWDGRRRRSARRVTHYRASILDAEIPRAFALSSRPSCTPTGATSIRPSVKARQALFLDCGQWIRKRRRVPLNAIGFAAASVGDWKPSTIGLSSLSQQLTCSGELGERWWRSSAARSCRGADRLGPGRPGRSSHRLARRAGPGGGSHLGDRDSGRA